MSNLRDIFPEELKRLLTPVGEDDVYKEGRKTTYPSKGYKKNKSNRKRTDKSPKQ